MSCFKIKIHLTRNSKGDGISTQSFNKLMVRRGR